MGMFDNVKYEAPCEKCGEPLKGWQSKSGDAALQVLTPQELAMQAYPDPAKFYDFCRNCETMNYRTVTITGPLPDVTIQRPGPDLTEEST